MLSSWCVEEDFLLLSGHLRNKGFRYCRLSILLLLLFVVVIVRSRKKFIETGNFHFYLYNEPFLIVAYKKKKKKTGINFQTIFSQLKFTS